eukprot:TRINITY_DN61832_c0_g1_i1.p1 TRINITY_DN61832_c0_g1~~TRINITY_DN61832_c0_g1_i1.p1  ORF type:complete len:505 (+),score=109.83 TRINITY_DN61832_c0_g1_i1:59-1573(+)
MDGDINSKDSIEFELTRRVRQLETQLAEQFKRHKAFERRMQRTFTEVVESVALTMKEYDEQSKKDCECLREEVKDMLAASLKEMAAGSYLQHGEAGSQAKFDNQFQRADSTIVSSAQRIDASLAGLKKTEKALAQLKFDFTTSDATLTSEFDKCLETISKSPFWQKRREIEEADAREALYKPGASAVVEEQEEPSETDVAHGVSEFGKNLAGAMQSVETLCSSPRELEAGQVAAGDTSAAVEHQDAEEPSGTNVALLGTHGELKQQELANELGVENQTEKAVCSSPTESFRELGAEQVAAGGEQQNSAEVSKTKVAFQRTLPRTDSPPPSSCQGSSRGELKRQDSAQIAVKVSAAPAGSMLSTVGSVRSISCGPRGATRAATARAAVSRPGTRTAGGTTAAVAQQEPSDMHMAFVGALRNVCSSPGNTPRRSLGLNQTANAVPSSSPPGNFRQIPIGMHLHQASLTGQAGLMSPRRVWTREAAGQVRASSRQLSVNPRNSKSAL